MISIQRMRGKEEKEKKKQAAATHVWEQTNRLVHRTTWHDDGRCGKWFLPMPCRFVDLMNWWMMQRRRVGVVGIPGDPSRSPSGGDVRTKRRWRDKQWRYDAQTCPGGRHRLGEWTDKRNQDIDHQRWRTVAMNSPRSEKGRRWHGL
jgi:hypothetical protein